MRLKQKIRSVLYAPKHIKPTDENIMGLLLPSLVGIVICMICLTGMTWAWFSASITIPAQQIQAANYEVTVSVMNDRVEIPAENGKYTLQNGENAVQLTAVGNASNGYCKILINDTPYYTPQFPNPADSATEFSFTIRVSEAAEMTIVPIWGTYTGTDVLDDRPLDLSFPPSDETISSGENIGQTYTVVSDDSLWKIAQGYDGISAEDIAAYNSIENPNALQIGQVLNIPTAPQNAPESPMPEETQSSNTKAEGSAHADGIDSSVSTTTTSVYQ